MAGRGLYDDWAEFLEHWAQGEPADAGLLRPIDSSALPGDAWERLVNRVTDAVTQRLNTWSAVTSREISGCRDEFAVGLALTQARTGLRSVRLLAAHPGLPDSLREQLLGMVDRQVGSMQQTLEEQAHRTMREGGSTRGAEARLRTYRDNPLTAVITPAATATARDGWLASPAAPSRRRVIPG